MKSNIFKISKNKLFDLYFLIFEQNYFKYLSKIFIKIIFIYWSIYFLNISIKTIKRNNSSKGIKVCLCIMGKQENLYAREYVNYYKNLGYNHIFLYDNNDLNGEKFEDVLQDYLKERFVTIINYRGYRGRKLRYGDPQLKIYYDCYKSNGQYYDWLSFFDFDEFLELYPNNLSIQEFLNNKRYDKCQNIKINFLFYSDNELLYYDNRTVQKRFITPLFNHTNNIYIKSTVRGGLKENFWKKGISSHTSSMNYVSCNSLGEIIRYNNNTIPFNNKLAILKHYYTKSVEEYCNKTKRGEAFFYIEKPHF